MLISCIRKKAPEESSPTFRPAGPVRARALGCAAAEGSPIWVWIETRRHFLCQMLLWEDKTYAAMWRWNTSCYEKMRHMLLWENQTHDAMRRWNTCCCNKMKMFFQSRKKCFMVCIRATCQCFYNMWVIPPFGATRLPGITFTGNQSCLREKAETHI